MTGRRRLVVAVVAVAVVAVVVALVLASGGDDDDEGLTGDTAAEATDDSGDDDSDTTSDATDGAPIAEGDVSEWCARSAELDAADPFDALDDDAPPEDVEAAFDELEPLLEDYVAEAPDEVSDDIDTLVDTYNELRDLLEEYDYDVLEAMDDPDIDNILSPEVEAAGNRVDAFEEANC